MSGEIVCIFCFCDQRILAKDRQKLQKHPWKGALNNKWKKLFVGGQLLIQVWNFIKINFFAAVFKLFYQHSSGKFCVTFERFTSSVYFQSIFSSSRSSYLQAFCEKGVFKNFSEFKAKHLCQSLLSNKVAGSFKKRLLHRPFSVNSLKFIRAAMFCKTST